MAEPIQLGSDSGIQLELLPGKDKSGATNLAWAQGRLRVNGLLAIAGNDESFIEWTWVDLLEWLAENWTALLCEQSLPFQMRTTGLLTLFRDLEQCWEDATEERVEAEELAAIRFMGRHDLASGFKGLFVPGLYLFRVGNTMEITVTGRSKTLRLPLLQTVNDLTEIGDGIAALLQRNTPGRGAEAVKRWDERNELLKINRLKWMTGLDEADLGKLNPDNDPTFWEDPHGPLFADTELMAAARMTVGVMTIEEQQQLLSLVRQLPVAATPELNELSERLKAEFKDIGKPHDQGYWVAIWLRRALGISPHARVRPSDLLHQWEVGVTQFELPGSALDALACWGSRHGPAILINKARQNTPGHLHGENSTLAHEICHLLLDRSDALPVAEALNGNTPERLEKRARAFAAEFLLPRELAASRVRNSASLEAAVHSMSEDYGVSLELASWQIVNSDAFYTLTPDEQRWLRRHASPGGFRNSER